MIKLLAFWFWLEWEREKKRKINQPHHSKLYICTTHKTTKKTKFTACAFLEQTSLTIFFNKVCVMCVLLSFFLLRQQAALSKHAVNLHIILHVSKTTSFKFELFHLRHKRHMSNIFYPHIIPIIFPMST